MIDGKISGGETSKNLTIDGKTLAAGKYSLYTIPGKDKWTIIFNKTWDQWGTVYKESEDALRVNVKPVKAASAMEKMGDIFLQIHQHQQNLLPLQTLHYQNIFQKAMVMLALLFHLRIEQ